jgi:hypothetical protein
VRDLLFTTEDAKRKYVRYVKGIGKVACYALSRAQFGSTAISDASTYKAYSGARA